MDIKPQDDLKIPEKGDFGSFQTLPALLTNKYCQDKILKFV
jgi:hypothetical protein